jgi:mannose-6-phosphate isomerase-like protein (cupin superfamily)
MSNAIILPPDEGHTLTASGTRTTFKVTSETTNGRFSFAEYRLPPNFPGPPPHFHNQFEHAWYILEGAVQVQLDGHTHIIEAGTFVYIPSGTPHTFSNPGQTPARLLAIDTPGGLEPYYEEIAQAFPDGTPPKRDVIAAIQARYDTHPAS